MVCERCNKKKVAVLYRENVSGRVRALRLCGDCAETLEQAGELEDVSAAVAGFAAPQFLVEEGSYPLPFHGLRGADGRMGGGSPRACAVCGATMEDISAAGRVGCAACYTIFGGELAGVIRSAHGRAEHTGRVSAGYRARLEKTERLANLRKQLKDAVAQEKYETAAGLRDNIRALEAEL